MTSNLTPHQQTLLRAYNAWTAAATLRSKRQRNKRFTYGDQWGDTCLGNDGRLVTEFEAYSAGGTTPQTNNLIRQMVKTIVGRYRSENIDGHESADKNLAAVAARNQLGELDCRSMEEFLISGSAVQRVDVERGLWQQRVTVTAVNPDDFFIDRLDDPLCRDVTLAGQLHDLPLPQLIQRLAPFDRKRAAQLRQLYTTNADNRRTLDFAAHIGADTHRAQSFWFPEAAGTVRAIEVWTQEWRERLLCHDRNTARVWIQPASAPLKRSRGVTVQWHIAPAWHYRWFSPAGDLLAEGDSPWAHDSHPFVMKFYPLTDGEVHSFVEDIIDQQKAVNHLVTLINNIMMASAKGVLLFPENALPDGFTWDDIRRVWRNCNGILPYNPTYGTNKPEQISMNNTNIGAYEMVKLQMQLLEEISGVTGALRGHAMQSGNSATLYQNEAANAVIALSDIFGTFTNFRRNRDSKILEL